MLPFDATIQEFVSAHGLSVAFVLGVAIGLLLRGQNPIEFYRKIKGGKNNE